MTDRELLELAAKAAGYTLKWGEEYIVGDDKIDCTDMSYVVSGQPDEADWYWSPLEDDGDALRLAVKLGICFGPNFDENCAVCFGREGRNIVEEYGADPYAATRRAIVRAAAAIGRG
jgi:hypothetical protein